jgi:hypothetical protein
MKLFLMALTASLLAGSAQAGDRYLMSPDGTYLGELNDNKYDPDSISNPYGKYGSPYSEDSVNNPYGKYGSPYSNKSFRNPYATEAPIVIGE